ncbi:MAG: hypothetical protein CVU38_14230 [Chloroflexi bacterium HGW-Chloroflexi-1]|nr:MAG: hypothetical protein CVU38_14230 [Chloroflexi bacterium HGW-Chloroflexi-1]
MAQQVGDVERREGEDDTGRKGGPSTPPGSEDLPRQQVGPEPTHDKAEERHAVVGRQQPPGDLHRQDEQAVEGIEGVEQQPDAGGVIQQVGEKGLGVLLQQRHLDPPQVPIVLPAIEPVAWDGAGELRQQRVGQHQGEQEIAGRRERSQAPSGDA